MLLYEGNDAVKDGSSFLNEVHETALFGREACFISNVSSIQRRLLDARPVWDGWRTNREGERSDHEGHVQCSHHAWNRI